MRRKGENYGKENDKETDCRDADSNRCDTD